MSIYNRKGSSRHQAHQPRRYTETRRNLAGRPEVYDSHTGMWVALYMMNSSQLAQANQDCGAGSSGGYSGSGGTFDGGGASGSYDSGSSSSSSSSSYDSGSSSSSSDSGSSGGGGID